MAHCHPHGSQMHPIFCQCIVLCTVMDPDTTFSPIEFKVIDAQQNQTLQFEANQIEQLRWNY